MLAASHIYTYICEIITKPKHFYVHIMKKYLYAFVLPAIMLLSALQASADQYRIDIDNVDNVEFFIQLGEPAVTPVQADGLYTIDMGNEQYLRVITKPGVLFSQVIGDENGYITDYMERGAVTTMDDGRQYVDVNSYYPDVEIFRIRTASAGDARSASCTVNIDNPDRIRLTRNNEPVALTAGANTVKFDPEKEKTLVIEPVGKPLYRVSKGEEVFTADYRYTIPVADGDVIDIKAEFPDTDCPVSFNVVGYGSADFITGVDVDGRPELDWKRDGFSVKCGTELTLYGNLNEYEVVSFTVNGEAQMFTDKTPLFITEPTEIAIDVRKYASFIMTVIVDDPTHLQVYRGHVANNDPFELTAGENRVEITRNTPIISIVPADGYYINTLSLTGEEYEPYELQVSPVRLGSLVDDDVLTITTAAIVRDLKAMIYLENSSAAEGYFTAKRGDLSVIENLADGYNELMFYDRDNRFRFETGGPVQAHVYLNERLQEPEPGGFNYSPTLADGDILKLYFGEAPEAHTLTIDADANAAKVLTVIRDHIAEVDDYATVEALHNTHISLAAKDDSKLTVTLDGNPMTAGADGRFEFSATADHTVTVKGEESGIAEISADGGKSDAEIYDLRGVRVNRAVKGFYVVGGKKVIK